MKKIFVIANQKGGIGKTTTATAMASILNSFGHKTLLIDADPSGNSTDTFKGKIEDVPTLYDVILDKDDPTNLEDAIQETGNGYLIASDPLLLKADSICSGDPNGLFMLKDALEESMQRGALDDYEYIIIDTQPVINTLLHNCLIAADSVIIPITTDRYAVTGLYKLSEVIDAIRKRQNPSLEIYGLLLVKFNPRQKLSKSVKEYLVSSADKMGTVLLSTAIRESVAAREAQAIRVPLIKYSSACTTELDYEDFVEMILEEEG